MKKRLLTSLWLLGSLWLCVQPSLRAQTTPTVGLAFDLAHRGAPISADHYGIFFEEINYAGDGGLYAELVRNRSFEDDANTPVYWHTVGTATMSLNTTRVLNTAQTRALRIVFAKSGDGVRNEGFWGMAVKKGESYSLSLFVKSNEGYDGTLTAQLQSQTGRNLGQATMAVEADGQWRKLTATLTATEDYANAMLALKGEKAGALTIDVVSLFPPTFRDRPNGCRRDLAEKLQALHPGFVRFPGGCYVEGMSDGTTNHRFNWRTTVGPIEKRPGHRNQNWGYRVSDGFGYHEMLQLTEDLGAQALFVVNVGIGHGWMVPYNQIDDYVSEALDAIEYARGDTTTTYGRLRADNGHPEPFPLKYIEIGNENYNFVANGQGDQSDHYAERYFTIYKAIKERWPDIVCVGNVESWGTDAPSWRNPYPVDVLDEHYYRNPYWFMSAYNKYDSYSRAAADIYVGEYATTENAGWYGTMNAALGEAIYMLGMERNADVVRMASYAPLFCNENAVGWHPDLIRFNASTSYGIPGYYVQRMFAQNIGKENVTWTETGNSTSSYGCTFGLGTWLTAATFSNLNVTSGSQVISGDTTATTSWQTVGGTWQQTDTTFSQTNTGATPATYIYHGATVNTDDITMEVTARKNSGREGFLILIDYQDADNYTWWNIGGWGNTKQAIEQCIAGVKTTIGTAGDCVLEDNRDYRLRVTKSGRHVTCYMDERQLQDVNLMTGIDKQVYTAASIDDEAKMLYVKLVNPNSKASSALLTFSHGRVTDATLEQLRANSGTDENTTNNPTLITAKERKADVADDGTISISVPPFSVNVLRLSVDDVTVAREDTAKELPKPLISYSFEHGLPADDSQAYTATLAGKARIETDDDGNHVLYTGAMNGRGHLNLTTKMGRDVAARLTGDYTATIRLKMGAENNSTKFCWAYALANGTQQYLGMVNGTGHDWYLEQKNGNTQGVHSHWGLSADTWHTLTYVQSDGQGTLYIDGLPTATADMSIRPADYAASIGAAYIGRSPFSADAYMENTWFDDFAIFDTALTPSQVRLLATGSKGLATRIDAPATTEGRQPATTSPRTVFDLSGRRYTDTTAPHGIIIDQGRKALRKN